MSSQRVLVVDDEVEVRRALSRALGIRGYEVQVAADGHEALEVAPAFHPDLVVLDLNMPGLDGFEVCRAVRKSSTVPILVLSVREDEADKVAALDLGADDYLTKPFGVDELLARVRALLRRSSAADGTAPRTFELGELHIDMEEQIVRRGARTVHLTRTEWELLRVMSQHPGRLLTHGWLLERVWGSGYEVDVLRTSVSRLRRKIEPDAARPRLIVTDPGIGYRWMLSPETADRPA